MNKKIIVGIISVFFLFLIFDASFAATVSFSNPTGIQTMKDFFMSIFKNLQGILILIAILFIVIGGIFYITAGDSAERVKTAKSIWVGSIVGLLIALLAPTFLREIQNALLLPDADGNPIMTNNLEQVLSLSTIIKNVLSTLLSIIGILTIISLVISGFTYVFSFGDSSRAEKAKEMIKWSIFGLALAGASVIIVRQIASFIGPTV